MHVLVVDNSCYGFASSTRCTQCVRDDDENTKEDDSTNGKKSFTRTLVLTLNRIVHPHNVHRVATPKQTIKYIHDHGDEITHVISSGSNLRFTENDNVPNNVLLCNTIALALLPNAHFLGICFGFQLLATLCGGTVRPDKDGGTFGNELILDSVHGEQLVAGYHNDVVIDAGRGFDVMAVSAACPNVIQRAVRIEDNNKCRIGVQWHPEKTKNVLGVAFLKDFLRLR